MKWTAKLALSTEQEMGKVVEGWGEERGTGGLREIPCLPSQFICIYIFLYTVDNQAKHE